MTAIVRDTGGEGGQVDLPTSLHCAKAQLDHLELGCAALVCALMSVGLNYLLGRDLNWDYFNYHAYAAQLMVQDRLAQDFFAAGYQGYMNPLPFLPFALMNQAGWSALQIGSGLALIQSLDAFFVYLIAREFTSQSPAPRLSAAVVAFLGCATAIYASQLGSSFVDASTAVPVMAGLWLICRRQTVPNFCAAAALAGAAVALKLTNVPFAAATLLATAFCVEVRSTAGRAKALIQASAAMGIGFLLLYAWWGWKLQHLFGSPVFPLFNQIFRAPDFPAESMRLDRFVPQSLGALLSLPMRMAEQSSWIYTEVVAPDIRPAVLILLLLGVVLLRLRRSLPVFGALAPEPRLRVVGTYFLSALALWFATSANGRYALPLLFLLGPFCYVAATRLLGARVGLAACAIVVILQTAHAAIPGNPRWNPHPWSAEWLPASIPSVLRDKPALFVVVGLSSESYLAGYMNPQSSFINPIGLLSLRTNGPGWDRFEALRARYAGDTWVVFPEPPRSQPQTRAKAINVNGQMVDRLGLIVDPSNCVSLAFNVGVNGESASKPDPERNLLSCKATVRSGNDPELAAQRRTAEEIMNAFERRCPKMFSPNGTQVEGFGPLWSRLYGRFDLYLTLDFAHRELRYRQDRQTQPLLIARLDTWREDLDRFKCRLPFDGDRGDVTLGPPPP